MVLTIAREGEIALVTVDNPPVNALSRALRQALFDAVEQLDADPGVRGVVLACSGRTFIAGADVSEFGKPPEPPHLPDVVARLASAAKPWVAAIHGTALGGGVEIALACRFRVAAPTAALGFPEVNIGTVPGAGGSAMLPRLVPAQEAAAMITSGKPVGAARALEIGLVDAVLEGDLTSGATDFLRDALARPLPAPIPERAPVTRPDAEFWSAQHSALERRARGQVAPLAALECVRKGVEADFDAATAFARERFLALRDSEQARALRHIFFAERAAPRPPELRGVEARPLDRAGVVGGGTMGVGIAMALLSAGLPVTLIERDDDAAQRARAAVAGLLDASARKGRLTSAERDARLSRLHCTTDHAALSDADLVVEAVFEELDVKREVFARLDAVCRADAVLATNTSYLDPEAIAAATARPERVLGLHFFSPAHVMKLLEIVPTEQTAPEVLATGFALARRLGKVPVRAGICEGFIGNRILKLYRTTAERLLLTGLTPAEIDAALTGFGFAMGIFAVQDMAGLDIGAAQRRAARARGETPFAPVADRLVELGRIGRKAGAGWYDYPDGARGTPQPSDVVSGIIADEAAKAGLPRLQPDPQDLAEHLLFPMIDEGARILDEGIARRAADIDLVELHGYGFPRWRGGLMYYAVTRGLPEIAAKLETMHEQGLAPSPSGALRRAAENGSFST